MKLSRDFLWGMGAGLILSALLILGVNALLNQSGNEEKQQSPQEETTKGPGTGQENGGESQSKDIGQEDANKENVNKEDVSQETPNQANTEAPAEPAKEVTVTIPPGATSEDVAIILKNQGLIEDSTAFNDYILAQNQAARLHYGTFTLQIGWSEDKILDYLITKY